MGVAALDSPPKTHVTLVRVDVIASDARGRSVENLKPADFAVTEDASPQLIDALQFVKADGGVPGDLHGVTKVLVTQEPAGGSLVPTSAPVIVAPLA